MIKGQGSETPFMLSLMVIVVFLAFFTTQIAPRYPEFSVLTGFDAIALIGGIVLIAGTCVVATGLPCAGALLLVNGVVFFSVGNTLVALLIFTPLTITLSYVLSRLGRGGG
jgi:hypothetical protein